MFKFEKNFAEVLRKIDRNLKENPLLKDTTIVVEELIDIDIQAIRRFAVFRIFFVTG